MDDFDKEFRKMVISIIVFCLLVGGFMSWVIVKAGQEVKEKGLKGVVHEIWEGENIEQNSRD